MTDTSFIFRDVIQYKLQKLFCQMNFIHDKRRKKEKGKGFLPERRSAGPEAGRGVPTPPSLPLDSTHPATGQGLLALDNPKEEVKAQKS